MILTVNNDPTKPVTYEDIRTLAECDRASSYPECGWYCLSGHKDGRRVVHAHANSERDFMALAAHMGYRWTGYRMVEMSTEERRECRPYAAFKVGKSRR